MGVGGRGEMITGSSGGVLNEKNRGNGTEDAREQLSLRLQEENSPESLREGRWTKRGSALFSSNKSLGKESRPVSRSVFEKYRENLATVTGTKWSSLEAGSDEREEKEEQDSNELLSYIRLEPYKNFEGRQQRPSSPKSSRSSINNGRIQGCGGQTGGSPTTSSPGSPCGGREPWHNINSSHKADVHRLLSLCDVEAAFMNFTMSSTPNQQLLQLRVLELFQEWVTSPEVLEELDLMLEISQRQVGLKPFAREGWKLEPSPTCPPIGTSSSFDAGEEQQHLKSVITERRHLLSDGSYGGSRSEERKKEEGGLGSLRSANTGENGEERLFFTEFRSKSVSPLREGTHSRTGCDSPLVEPPPLIKLGINRGEKSTLSRKRSSGQESLLPHDKMEGKETKGGGVDEESEHAASSGISMDRISRGRRSGASYDDIPRFYFPLGKPTTKEKVISEPIFKFHENPHLRLSESVIAVAPQAGRGSLTGVEGKGGNGGENAEGFSLITEVAPSAIRGAKSSDNNDNNNNAEKDTGEAAQLKERLKPKIPPMSTLRLVDDRNVHTQIKKEFGRMNGFSRHRKARLSASRRITSGDVKESQLRQHFYVGMERICTQCFGVPKYFAYLIIGLIQLQLVESGVCPPQTDSVAGGVPFINSQSYAIIKAEHVQAFYEKYLKHKDTVRRTFDLLILSSRLSTKTEDSESENSESDNSESDEEKKNSKKKKSHGDSPGSARGSENESNGSKRETSGRRVARVLEDLSTLRAHLQAEDFKAYLLTLVCYHPSLQVLAQAPEFQVRYIDTVIYRIFYDLDRFDRDCISFGEFMVSALLDAFREVDASEDISNVLLYFSYEHFYVLCSLFGDLDLDRDLMLSREDLMEYSPQGTMNPLIVERVFKGAGRRLRCTVADRIGYEDFVWFCLSEEDKSTVSALRYWFKVLDTDEDGVISIYELKAFFDATTSKGGDFLQDNPASFENTICQVFDMLRCNEFRGLRLKDFLADRVASYVAINMITNIVKFIQFEFKDPFVSHQERLDGSLDQTPWDRFARIEYERMMYEGQE